MPSWGKIATKAHPRGLSRTDFTLEVRQRGWLLLTTKGLLNHPPGGGGTVPSGPKGWTSESRLFPTPPPSLSDEPSRNPLFRQKWKKNTAAWLPGCQRTPGWDPPPGGGEGGGGALGPKESSGNDPGGLQVPVAEGNEGPLWLSWLASHIGFWGRNRDCGGGVRVLGQSPEKAAGCWVVSPETDSDPPPLPRPAPGPLCKATRLRPRHLTDIQTRGRN